MEFHFFALGIFNETDLSHPQMEENLRLHIGFEDHILFRPTSSMELLHTVREGLVVGKIIACAGCANTFQVRVFHPMTSEFLQLYSLPPITTAQFPMASQAHMLEVVSQDIAINVARASVCDIAHVVPLLEVESGLYNMSGSNNSFFIRYSLRNGIVEHYMSEYYFLSRPVEPISIRLFHSLNFLAGLVKKSLYHQGEAESCSRTFRLFFCTEAFCYLCHRLSSETMISSDARKQTFILYYDTLGMEARANYITKTHLRIVTKPALSLLQQMLGIGVGLGLTKRRPTKKSPLVHCTVGSFLTAVEVGENLPVELVADPKKRYHGDSVEFLYTEESRQLTCTVRYSKMIINTHAVATSRIRTAEVHKNVLAGAYVDANFHYNGELMTILSIQNDFATCRYLPNDIDSDIEDITELATIDLPLQQVHELVASFGR